ncbi:MAG: DUF3365 domain-containing protein [Bacteroidetes bacterium]|nr:DUF3365 domain-containing protein [Bacteroidota bacterium]HET6243657.1 DUF3365 domain-containing protein [Bacteroidia bacterium]
MVRLFSILSILSITVSSCLLDHRERSAVLAAEEESINNYRRLGDSITLVIQANLLKNINSAIEEKGEAYAIQFCNLKIIELTHSLSQKYSCMIRRVSLKNRNRENEPFNDFEKEQLEKYTAGNIKGEPLMDELQKREDAVYYYKPIFVANNTCLKCHGESGKEIDLATEIKLYKYYPLDKATGYKIGDLRGMWSLKFKKHENTEERKKTTK